MGFFKSIAVTSFLLAINFTGDWNDAKAFGWFKVPSKNKAMLELGTVENKENALNPNEIDLLVWNTYKGQNPSWTQDFSFLVLDKEIVVLQEAILNDIMKPVFENQSEFHYKIATSFIYTKTNIPTGTATGSVVYPTNFYFKKTRDVEAVGFTPKVTLFTEYALKGRSDKLLVINIHALNSVPAFILKRHINDAKVEIEKHKGPVVFAGDFNTWSWLKLRVMRKTLEKLGMTEVQFPNGGERMRSSISNNIIDYIWVKGIDYSDSWVWGNLEGADHKALTVRLKIKS